MAGRLAGGRFLITGGASGIGRATVALFAAEGARVAVLDRDAAAAQSVAESVGGIAVPVDLADAAAVERAVAEAAGGLGGLDGVVNAAGIFHHEGLADTSAELFARTLAVNLTGTFLVAKAAAPFLQQERARQHRQHRLGRRPHAHRAGQHRLCRLQGGGHRADQGAGLRAGAQGAGQRDLPRRGRDADDRRLPARRRRRGRSRDRRRAMR